LTRKAFVTRYLPVASTDNGRGRDGEAAQTQLMHRKIKDYRGNTEIQNEHTTKNLEPHIPLLMVFGHTTGSFVMGVASVSFEIQRHFLTNMGLKKCWN